MAFATPASVAANSHHGARSQTAYIRCAAAFKGLLAPAGLEAWQAARGRPGMVARLDAQGASNSLLAWGTLAASDPQLAAAVDRQLAAQLLRHAVSGISGEALSPRHAANVLYGAALLELRPSAAQAAARSWGSRGQPACTTSI